MGHNSKNELSLSTGYNNSAGYYRASGIFMDHPRQFVCMARSQQQKLKLVWLPTLCGHKEVAVSVQWSSAVPSEQQVDSSLTSLYRSVLSPHPAWTASREGHFNFCFRLLRPSPELGTLCGAVILTSAGDGVDTRPVVFHNSTCATFHRQDACHFQDHIFG